MVPRLSASFLLCALSGEVVVRLSQEHGVVTCPFFCCSSLTLSGVACRGCFRRVCSFGIGFFVSWLSGVALSGARAALIRLDRVYFYRFLVTDGVNLCCGCRVKLVVQAVGGERSQFANPIVFAVFHDRSDVFFAEGAVVPYLLYKYELRIVVEAVVWLQEVFIKG